MVQVRGHHPEGCEDALVIDASWSVEALGDSAQRVEGLLRDGALLMGCEDEVPTFADDPDGPRLILVTTDDLASKQRDRLEKRFEVSLLGLHPQGFSIAWDRQGVLIAGGSHPGLVYGVGSWLRSLDHVQTADGAWAPDPTSEFTSRHECSDYDGLCLGDASCWEEGWSPVEALTWCPETVSDFPAVDTRMGFASFKGTIDAHFLPNLFGAGLGTCDQPDDTSPFWEATLGCERGVGTCNDVRDRLDVLVAGRFTHALDEGYPVASGSTIEELTGCSGAQLYADLDRYLDERGVELVPSVFGLETRVNDTPVAGPRLESTPYAEWGAEGDVTLSEGLAVLPRTMTVCAVDERLFLAEDCADLDAEGRVSAPKTVTPVWDQDTLALPTELSGCDEPLGACQVKECWTAEQGARGLALKPDEDCTNPAIRLPLPLEEPYAGRLYALGLRALITDTKDLRVKVVTRDSEGFTNAQDVVPIDGDIDEADYVGAKGDTLSSNTEWVRLAFVFRVPAEDRVTEAYVQLLGLPGTDLWIDDLQLYEVDAQLPRVDAASVRIWAEEELDCFSVDPGFSGPLGVAGYFTPEGDVSGPLASIEVEPGCLEEGDEVRVAYRTWIHAGLWPGLSARQSHWSYSPGVYTRGWWEHPDGPRGQLQALAEAGVESDFLALSDLGGEARGIDRASPNLYETSPSETLASYVCGVQEAACDVWGDCAIEPTCEGMFEDPLGGDFSPCACTDASSETRLLVAGDMFTPWHNGGDHDSVPGREAYQVPHAGFVGGTQQAADRVPASTVFLSWWHYDVRRVGKDDIGHETLMSFVRDLTGAGLSVIGASAWDPDAARAWAALAAGTGRTHGFDVPGVAHFGWGTDRQGPRVMRQAGHYFWSPGWALVDNWMISDNADLPGGVEAWTATGVGLEESAYSWPHTGQLLALGDTAVWDSPYVDLDPDWPKELLVRFHTRLPEGCAVSATVHGEENYVAEVRGVVADRLDVTTARVDLPDTEARVSVRLAFAGCAGGELDEVAIYQAVPGTPFPYRHVEEGLADWPSPMSVDARYKVCGDGRVADCKNAKTFSR